MEPLAIPIEIPPWITKSQNISDINSEFSAGLEHLVPGYDKHDPDKKPFPVRVIPANIPQELKDVPQWVCWKYEWNGTKWTKPPYRPNGYKASKTNPQHYSDFSRALAAYKKGSFDGIGFVLTDHDPFVAVDIDNCLNGTVLTDEAREIIKTVNCYTEVSPSGTGIRIFVKGTTSRNVKKKIEIYSMDSFVTVTGRKSAEEVVSKIEWRQAELDNLFHKYAGETLAVLPETANDEQWTQADQDLCAKISRSKQGERWGKLFDGQFDDYGSQSEADLALCSMLAFWCRKDAKQMDRIFRESRLYRLKWDEVHGQQTYGQMTIQKAIDATENVYSRNQADISASFRSRVFELVQAGKIEMKPIQWLIQDLVERDSLVLLFGDPGCGKSFFAIAVALCVATGSQFYGRDVKRGPVIYVAGEGHNGLKRRMMAWSLANKVGHDDAPLFVSMMPAALTDADMVKEIQAAIKMVSAEHGSPVLIVIDTLARNFGPGDENSTQDMSKFIQAADDLRTISQATVLIVHHNGHGDKGRARGAMALKGALDAEYRLDKDEAGTIRMEATKMKDAKYPEPCAFQLRSVPLNVCNSDGEPEFSAVLETTSYAPPPQKGKAGHGKHQTQALAILKDLQNDERRNYSAEGKDPATVRVSVDVWKKAMKAGGMPSQRISEVVKSLRDLRMITEGGGYVSPL